MRLKARAQLDTRGLSGNLESQAYPAVRVAQCTCIRLGAVVPPGQEVKGAWLMTVWDMLRAGCSAPACGLGLLPLPSTAGVIAAASLPPF